MTRSRRTIAIACVAIVVLAAVFPLGVATLDWCACPSEFVLLPPTELALRPADVPDRPEQPLRLAAPLDGRGPPPVALPA